MLDTRSISSFADYFVICTSESDRQTRAIFDEVEGVLRQEGVRAHHREGDTDSGWFLLDFGDVVVHIFSPEERERYALDDLWKEAKPLLRIQ